MNEKETLKALIGRNKIDEAIVQLQQITQGRDADLYNEVILQSSNWKELKRQQRLGILDAEEDRVRTARVNNALLEIIDQLPATTSQATQPPITSSGATPVNQPIEQPGSANRYLFISIGALVITLALFFLLAYFQDRLSNRLGERAYYILLFPLAFSAAAFLFGVMRTYAAYTHSESNRKLELGGPIVAAILVIVAGFRLVPDSEPFNFSVIIKSETLKPEFGGATKGIVKLHLANDIKTAELDKDGVADFKAIPSELQNREIQVELDFPNWQFAGNHSDYDTLRLNGQSTYLTIEPDGSWARVYGVVRDNKQHFLAGVTLTIDKLTTTTDSLGRFEFIIPPAQQKREQTLRAGKAGFEIWEKNVYPETQTETLILLNPIE